ncbi:MAG: response regulator transcription factor [Saprospiraceae bacterium]|nr:response regulator transcription factor [Saprospiraceae bacterium]
MKVVILEDESIAAKRLIRLLEEIDPDLEIAGNYQSIADTASHLLEKGQPDVLLLDIHVLDGNSMELFKILHIKSKVVFTTAYDEFAVEAFRKNAIDYLLKPIKKDELSEAIGKAKVFTNPVPIDNTTPYKTNLLAKFGAKVKNVEVSDIAYVHSRDKISYIHLHSGAKIATDFRLQDFEEMLDPTAFFRINRQYIASKNAIDQMVTHNASRFKVSLKPPIEDDIVISTEKTREFKKWLQDNL